MIHLTREVRFSACPNAGRSPVTNSWGGWPSASVVSPWLLFRCELAGELDPVSGYLCNIKLIDDVLRQKVIVKLDVQNVESYEAMLSFAFLKIRDEFPENCHLRRLQLIVSPTLDYTIQSDDDAMIQISQQFEFSASHRLHNPELSDDENRQLFGKCNNPHGHGHNYVVMVTLEGKPEHGRLVPLEAFESLVKRQVIDRMDHRNLNVEVQQFNEINPSVENIAMVIWEQLESEVGDLPGQSRLRRVRVYETPKTWADYSGSGS